MATEILCPVCAADVPLPDDPDVRDLRCPMCDAVFPRPRSRSRQREDDSDDRRDDEPRPRRRRRYSEPLPPTSAGRTLFWLAIIFGVLILGGFACCGGGYLLMPGEEWSTYNSPGGYSAEFPLKPNPNFQLPGVKPEPGVHSEGGVLWKRGECYAVTYGDIEARNRRAISDEQLLRDTVTAITKDSEVKRVLRDEAITVSGFPGREFEFEGEDGGFYAGRVVIANRRAFVALGGGRFVKRDNANIRRFVNSFKITDPTLRGNGGLFR